ncbi:peptidase inhibitor family I36 protein [Kribbella sp. NPDC056951]|uniref:peptidase inhibitor family I36 protein n=1 Tax=Kribbella sp. NPDC056951 TaxID=3345978 RepID=UPI003630FE79
MNLRIVLLGATTLVLGAVASPASAYSESTACEPGQACFYETTSFGGKSAIYNDVPTACTQLALAPGSLFNWSSEDVLLYRTPDCSGSPSLEPANNFHSYPGTKFLSFRAG